MATNLKERLASFSGRVRTTGNTGSVNIFTALPNAAAAGAFNPAVTPPTLADIGARTVNKNHLLYPARTGRDTLTVKPVGGNIRYGYQDRATLFQDGFLVNDGDVFEIPIPSVAYIAVPDGVNVEINFDNIEG